MSLNKKYILFVYGEGGHAAQNESTCSYNTLTTSRILKQ